MSIKYHCDKCDSVMTVADWIDGSGFCMDCRRKNHRKAPRLRPKQKQQI